MSSEKSYRIQNKTARFDTRLSPEQKALFEKAANIKGYKSLSDFVIQIVQEASTEIIDKHNNILASERDKKIFFDAMANPPKPPKRLIDAARAYKKLTSKR